MLGFLDFSVNYFKMFSLNLLRKKKGRIFQNTPFCHGCSLKSSVTLNCYPQWPESSSVPFFTSPQSFENYPIILYVILLSLNLIYHYIKCNNFIGNTSWNKLCILKELLKYKDISIFISSQISILTALHSKWDLSSSTRDQTHAPCSGSMESQPLDHQRSSSFLSNFYPFSLIYPKAQIWGK